jgi:hypothetical protein
VLEKMDNIFYRPASERSGLPSSIVFLNLRLQPSNDPGPNEPNALNHQNVPNEHYDPNDNTIITKREVRTWR